VSTGALSSAETDLGYSSWFGMHTPSNCQECARRKKTTDQEIESGAQRNGNGRTFLSRAMMGSDSSN
jgi:hypothetical protein